MVRNEGGEQETQGPPAWARRAGVRPSGWKPGSVAKPRLTVVGPCAAGKTTLVATLRALGYDAHAIAQEHSGVPYLWQLTEPDLLIFLDVDLATTARRRRREWSATLYATQHDRLAHARAHTDFYLDGSNLTAREVASQVLGFIASCVS